MSANQVGTADGRTQFSKPLLTDDYLYVGGLGQELRCYPRGEIDPDPAWTFTREGSLSDSSPILDEGRNQIYIGSGGGNLSAVDAGTGEQNWVVETDSAITSTPMMKQGHVFVGTNDGQLLRIDADAGTNEDSIQLDGAIYGTPVTVGADSKYFSLVTTVGTVYRLRWYDFDIDWKQETGGEGVRSAPIYEYDYGTIVATDKVYKLKQNVGDIQWEAEYGGSVATTPLYNGFVIVGDDEGTLTAFNRNTGDVRWSYDAGSPITSDPVQTGGGVVFGTQDGTIHSIAVSDETDVGTETVAGGTPSAPVAHDGVVYVAVDDNDSGSILEFDRATLGIEPLPTISAVESTGETDNGDPVYEVHGSNFGIKNRGAAVLYDFVDETYERGDLNTFNGDFYSNEQNLHEALPELDRVWDNISIPEEEQERLGVDRPQDKPPGQYISDENEQPHRHDGVNAHYRFRNGSFVGLPVAYGGRINTPDKNKRYERPMGNKQLYIAWWLRPTFDIRGHIAIEASSVDSELNFGGKRDRGERFRIPDAAPGGWDTDDLTGWIIGVRDGNGSSENDDGLLEVEFDRRFLGKIDGSMIIGEESGATAEIPEDPDTVTYTDSDKMLRTFDTGGRTFSFSWQANGLNVGVVERQSWGEPGFPDPQEWNLLEFVADIEEGWLEGWVNFEKRDRIEWDPAETETDVSPTLALVGMHTSHYGYNTFRMSEVYQDSSVQRLVIADAETLAEASHYELQRPIEWEDGSLRFALNDGQLPTDEQLYVFVFDDQGQANQQGYPMSLSAAGSEP